MVHGVRINSRGNRVAVANGLWSDPRIYEAYGKQKQQYRPGIPHKSDTFITELTPTQVQQAASSKNALNLTDTLTKLRCTLPVLTPLKLFALRCATRGDQGNLVVFDYTP